MTVRWHLARRDEVPADDEWLTDDERAVLAGLAIAKRRADWRLGRWTAKSLLAAVLGVPPRSCRGPGGRRRRAGCLRRRRTVPGCRSACRTATASRWPPSLRLPTRVGIDLETLETRSDAFVREWLSTDEQAALPSAGAARDLQVLCCWTGKEASAKVLREGLAARRPPCRRRRRARPPRRRWAPLR